MRLTTDYRLPTLTDSLQFFHRTTTWFKQRKPIPLLFLKHCKRLPAFSFAVVIALSGCGSNGGGAAAVATGTITGGAIKGPLDCRAQGSVIATGSTGKRATGSTPTVGSFSVDMTGLRFPITVTVSGCMDTITGASQEFDLSTMVMDSAQTVINATPLSTLAVAAANVAKVGGGAITQADLDVATATVLNAFGLSASLANPLTGAYNTVAEVTNLAVASEAVAEVIKRSATAAPGGASTANIVASFAADLADGALDGAAPAGVTIPVPVATAAGVNGNLIAKVFDEVAAGQLVISQVDSLTGVVMNVLPSSAFTNAVATMATATSGAVVTAASINPAATLTDINARPAAVPVIALVGANPLTVVQGSVFSDPGSSVTDNVDVGLTATVTGTVNTAIVGTYTLTYNASDAAGNAATAVTRSVTVTNPIVGSLVITEALVAQTHVLLPGGGSGDTTSTGGGSWDITRHPPLILIGGRDALAIVSFQQNDPINPKLEMWLNGVLLGTVVLDPPSALPPTESESDGNGNSINVPGPRFRTTSYSATIPAIDMKVGLRLKATADNYQGAWIDPLKVGADTPLIIKMMPLYLYGANLGVFQSLRNTTDDPGTMRVDEADEMAAKLAASSTTVVERSRYAAG